MLATPELMQNTEQKSLLVTYPRIIDNKNANIFDKWCVFVDSSSVNHRTKAQNFLAMEHYIEQKLPYATQKLMKKIYCKQHNWSEDLDFELKDIPLSVISEFEKSKIAYKNKVLLNYAQDQFNKYIWNIESKSRYIITQHTLTGVRGHIKLETRYCNSYCKKIEKRMKWLAHEYKNSSCVLLTLTLDPKKFGNDKFRMWKEIKPLLHEFMKKMRIHFKRHDRVFPKFIHAVEGQKNGNPHLHIVFLKATRLIDWRKILQYWGVGAIRINKTKDNTKVRYPINYVTKYITKTFANTNFHNIRTQSLVWLFNMKSFDRSHGLMIPLNPKGNGDWISVYMALVDRHSSQWEECGFIYNRLDVMFDPSSWNVPPPSCYEGDHVIYVENDGTVYSTDSLFWANFFGDNNDK